MVHKTIFLNVFATLFIMAIISISSFAATTPAAKKPKLVLLPLTVSDEDIKLQGAMENALVEGLQDKYQVFSGDTVKKKGREVFEKENKTAKVKCDETKCMEDIALAFNSELIATASVTKQAGGYFLSISIQNIFDNKVIYTKSLAYENQSTFQVINRLKELTGSQTVVNNTPIITTEPIKEKPIKPTANNGNSTLEIGCTGTDIGAEVWINDKLRGECPVGLKVPEGTLQLKVIKHIDTEHEGLLEQEVRIFPDTVKKVDVKLENRLTAEGKLLTEERQKSEAEAKQKVQLKAENAKGVWIDKETHLMWQDDEDAKTVEKDWQGAVDYCKNLTLADYDDWRLPDKETIGALYLKGSTGPFDTNNYVLKNMLTGITDRYWTSTLEDPPYMGQDVYFVNRRGIPLLTVRKPYFGTMTSNIRCVRDNK